MRGLDCSCTFVGHKGKTCGILCATAQFEDGTGNTADEHNCYCEMIFYCICNVKLARIHATSSLQFFFTRKQYSLLFHSMTYKVCSTSSCVENKWNTGSFLCLHFIFKGYLSNVSKIGSLKALFGLAVHTSLSPGEECLWLCSKVVLLGK